jgi:hypothetical protein
VSVALSALAVAGGIFFGRLLSRALRRDRQNRRGGAELPKSGEDAIPGDPESLEGFVCRLGDVVSRRVEGDEAWLAGALVFAEERPVAVLFIAPEAYGDRALLVPGPAQSTIAWLSPVPAADLGLPAQGGDPPRAIEHRGAHFERTRRLPVHVRRIGTGAPQVGSTGVFGEYVGPALERLVVVAGSVACLAWRGTAMTEEEYEVLPGGKATLEG